MDLAAPERTETNSGDRLSPKRRPVADFKPGDAEAQAAF